MLTLDLDPACDPDIVWDLERLPYTFAESNVFDAIIAEEVLEHTGQQGDVNFFFGQFAEFWRLLKSGGKLCMTCPRYDKTWAWGDPGHKRVITLGTLSFLCRGEYAKQLGNTSMTDYLRLLGKQDWFPEAVYYGEENLFATLVAKK